jgi:hypothetical protein
MLSCRAERRLPITVVRDVCQAKYGKGGKLIKLLKEAQTIMPQAFAGRILTDASGQFFTVVTETESANLAEWKRMQKRFFPIPISASGSRKCNRSSNRGAASFTTSKPHADPIPNLRMHAA